MIGVYVLNSLNEYVNIISKYDNDIRYFPQRFYARAIALKLVFEKTQKNPDVINIDTVEKEYVSFNLVK